MDTSPENIARLIAALHEEIPSAQVITDSDILDIYSRDETSNLAALPQIVVRADSTETVAAVVKLCSHFSVPFTPRGAGTGVTGGSVPVMGGVVISMEKMNRILEVDRENMTVTVEPGAITGEIQNAVLEQGLMYPPDPASLESCSIGGNVAENAGGPRAVKYGVTGDYVLSLDCVLPDGSIISTGGKYIKNATGYNIKGIIIGSEGTLAIITRIILRLIPAPAFTTDLLIPFASLDDAISAVFTILNNRIEPAALEFMERDALAMTAAFLGGNIPFPDAEAQLLVQLDAKSQEEIDRQLEAFMEIEGIDHEKIVVADSGPQRERIWKARRSIRHSIEAVSPIFFGEDCVVPRAEIASFIITLKKKLNAENLRSVMFGHAGDGNIHVNILKDTMNDGLWNETVPRIKRLIYAEAISHGGTITGEHGTGYLRKQYLSMAKNDAEIELYRRIKKAFDPRGLLNPGKIFP